jgi:hypothetical protein
MKCQIDKTASWQKHVDQTSKQQFDEKWQFEEMSVFKKLDERTN